MFDSTPPVVFATVQACVLTAISNLIAQWIKAYQTDTSYAVNWTPVIHFIIFTALNSPINFIWQSYLETSFPSNYLVPSKAALAAAAASNEQELDREQSTAEIFESKLSIRNTLIKFFLDQTIGAGVNTVLFLLGYGGISGKTWDQAMLSVRSEFWGLIAAGWKLWPLVSFFNFAVIKSVEMRGLVGCLAGMGWSIFLSLKQGSGGQDRELMRNLEKME